jgi:predicted nuclease with TOPRIM domain
MAATHARIQRLESLVNEAVRRIQRLGDENAKLQNKVGQLMEENGHLELQFRRFKALSQRQEKLRVQLEKILKKADKALDLC